MNVSVVIPTFNRAGDLNRCLTALSHQRSELYEIIVIDNGSTDATLEVAFKFDVRILQDASRNLSRLFNLGWQQAKGDVVAYLNDDSEPSPSWAEWTKRAFLENPEAAVVGGPTIDVNRRQIEALLARSGGSRLLRAAIWFYDKVVTKGCLNAIGLMFHTGGYSIGGYHESAARLKEAIEVDQLTITNMAVRRDLLAELGGFDERFLFNHADGDLFIRARNADRRLVFHPKVVVLHHANPAGPVRSPELLGVDTARFLLRSVHPHTIRDVLGWLANVLSFNVFWIYKTFETGSVSQLRGIRGFVQGIGHLIRENS